ncbi:MAG: RNA polymerase sigma factor [Rhizobiaceae bacterium]
MTTQAGIIADIYCAERTKLLGNVRRMLRDGQSAEDIVQQAFANLIGSNSAVRSPSAYINRAVRNLVYNLVRDEQRRRSVEVDGLDTERIVDERATPEQIAAARSELRLVLEAISKLPPRRREAFLMCRYEGLKYDEIAQRMGVSRNTVITQVVTALADLDRIMCA